MKGRESEAGGKSEDKQGPKASDERDERVRRGQPGVFS